MSKNSRRDFELESALTKRKRHRFWRRLRLRAAQRTTSTRARCERSAAAHRISKRRRATRRAKKTTPAVRGGANDTMAELPKAPRSASNKGDDKTCAKRQAHADALCSQINEGDHEYDIEGADDVLPKTMGLLSANQILPPQLLPKKE